MVGEVATKISLGVERLALAVAATDTGGPSGSAIVVDEKDGLHHFPFVLGASAISPPLVLVTCVFEIVPAVKSDTLVCEVAPFCKKRVTNMVEFAEDGIGVPQVTAMSIFLVDVSKLPPLETITPFASRYTSLMVIDLVKPLICSLPLGRFVKVHSFPDIAG